MTIRATTVTPQGVRRLELMQHMMNMPVPGSGTVWALFLTMRPPDAPDSWVANALDQLLAEGSRRAV